MLRTSRDVVGDAEAVAAGVSIDLGPLFGPGAHRVPLPSYAFQHRRYWVSPPAAPRDACALGQATSAHPLLGAMVPLAEGPGALFTGRLALDTHPWLADHVVMDTVTLPASAYLELALHAAQSLGASTVQELTVARPLVLDDGPVQLQVVVSGPDEQGLRELSVHSRPEPAAEADPPAPWVRHAEGRLGSEPVPDAPAPDLADPDWPPPEASPVALEPLYGDLASRGIEFGPSFTGLRGMWRYGEQIFATATLAAGNG